jgi:flagellar biosynthesis chaperone FliJ
LQQQSPIDPRAVLAADATLRGLARRVRGARERSNAAATVEQRARETWLDARKDARTLGQLELRAAELQRVERERLEGREYEELASQRGFAEATPSLADGEMDRT